MTAAVAVDAERALTGEGFMELQRQQLEAEIEVYPARAWYPSQLGHPCDRYLVWRFTKWQVQKKHDWILQAIFDEGRVHQPTVYARLERMGFDVVRESDRPTQYKVTDRAVISGRLDGKVRAFRSEKYRPLRVLEIKTTQGYQFDRLNTIADIQASEQHYIREYADQGHLYGFLENLPQGVIVLKNKATGVLKAIPYELDFGRAEELLQRVERLQPMVEQGTDPAPIPFDRMICGRCPFLHVCYPPKDFGAGAQLVDDAQLVEDLVARERLRAPRDQYEDLDKGIKARLKQLGMKAGASAIAGAFLIQVVERKVKEFSVKARTDTIFDIARMEAEQTPPAEVKPPAEDRPGHVASTLPLERGPGEAGGNGPPGTPAPDAVAAPAQPSLLEAKLFGEQADKVAAIERARGALKKPMPDAIWAGVCQKVCKVGPQELERSEIADLDRLFRLMDGVTRRDRALTEELNAIVTEVKRSAPATGG